MPFDNERDARRDESREAKYAQARRRAKLRERYGEDDDVDWSKTQRIAPGRSVKTSNLVAFGVPFAVASVALLWFSLHDRDKEVKPTAPTSFQAVLEENLQEKKNEDAALQSGAESNADQRVESVALREDDLENFDNNLFPPDDSALPELGDDLLPTEDAALPELDDNLAPAEDASLPELDDNLAPAEDAALPELDDDLAPAEDAALPELDEALAPAEDAALPELDDDLAPTEDAALPELDDDLVPTEDSALPELDDDLVPTEDSALPKLDDDLNALPPSDSAPTPADALEGAAPSLPDVDLTLPTGEAPSVDELAPETVPADDATTPADDLAPALDPDAVPEIGIDSALEPDAPAPDVELDPTAPNDAEPELSDALLDDPAPIDGANPTLEATAPASPESDASDFPDDSDAIEETRAQLAQLEFDFARIREGDSRDVDAVLASVDALLARARDAQTAAPDVAKDDVAAFASRVQEFQAFLERNAEFFQRLETLDEAALDPQAARAFFAPYLSGENATQDVDPEIAAYRAELARAGKALDALKTVDEWNDFIEEHGEKLQKFRVNATDSAIGLQFVETTSKKEGAPQDLATMAKRAPEWRFELTRNTGSYRKIVLMFEKELSQTYWTYAPERNRFYYLTAAPRVGTNAYVSSPKSDVMRIEIPEDAPELALDESPQKTALKALKDKAWSLTDELRERDPARWYKEWSEVLNELQTTDKLDPIIQYSFLREAAKRLSESDYHFKRRLEPLLNVLNAPQFEKKSALDRFSTDSQATIDLRNLAVSRINFLPAERLEVTKTTKELDATVARFAYLYKPVGWLDRNFAGEERCRRAADAPEIDVTGPLYVYVAEDEASASRWIQVGRAENGLLRLDVATATIPRGSIVFCKTSLTPSPAVAKRDAIEDVLKR